MNYQLRKIMTVLKGIHTFLKDIVDSVKNMESSLEQLNQLINSSQESIPESRHHQTVEAWRRIEKGENQIEEIIRNHTQFPYNSRERELFLVKDLKTVIRTLKGQKII